MKKILAGLILCFFTSFNTSYIQNVKVINTEQLNLEVKFSEYTMETSFKEDGTHVIK